MTTVERLLCLGGCLAAIASALPASAQNQAAGLRTSDLLSVQLYAVGGAFVPLGGNSTVSALDVSTVPGATSSVSGGASSIKPLLGALDNDVLQISLKISKQVLESCGKLAAAKAERDLRSVRLDRLKDRASHLSVPTPFRPLLYGLRLHIDMVRQEARKSTSP